MKALATAAAAAALMALGGCDRLGIDLGGGDGNNASAANQASANASGGKPGAAGEAAAAEPAAAAAGGKDPAGGAIPAASGNVPLDRAYMIGRWTDDGNCGNAVDFGSDGRFVAASGAGGLWHIAGDQLTMTGSATLTLQIVPIDQNTMTVVNADGSLGRSTRC